MRADVEEDGRREDGERVATARHRERTCLARDGLVVLGDLAFLFIEGMLVQARVIPSGSMENTVLIGDHLIVSRIGYDAGIPFTSWHVPLWRNPKRQQIIVFRAPLADQGYPDFIKRCIGMPGDHIKIVGGKVFVNGQQLVEPYAIHFPDAATFPTENYPEDADEFRLTEDGLRSCPNTL